MEKIKRFIECIIPVTACNLKCGYCYVIQEKRRTSQLPKFKYDMEHIGKALSQERLGGKAYISICGAGETLIPKEMPELIYNILKQGHYVNITTNGTITEKFDEIIKLPQDILKNLHFAFSFHYLELKRVGKLQDFFENVKKVQTAGCSFLVQLNLCDDYLPYLEEIKNICKNEIGAFPQVAATRNELTDKITLLTEHSKEEYYKIGQTFDSPLFEFTMKNFMVRRKEFCYAGDWSFLLDLSTGDMRKCYFSKIEQNIFEDITKPIKFEAIGNNCKCQYCINSSHFMSLGVIPTIDTPSYSQLRNREQAGWYSQNMKEFLNTRLYESNMQYKKILKLKTNINFQLQRIKNKGKRFLRLNK